MEELQEELQEDFKILIDAFISSDNENTEVLAKSLYKQAEKAFSIQRVSQQRELFENMQYYMEYCREKGYVTPQYWLEVYKHLNSG